MSTIFLISQDQKLLDELENSLPDHISVKLASSIEAVQALLDPLVGDCIGVLLDYAERNSWNSQLADLKREGVILLAVLHDSSERPEAFQAGVDDILIRPILRDELCVRLPFPRSDRITVEQAGLISTGRLTSHLCHEINNSMQAILGGLALAYEEPGISEDLSGDLELCVAECQRVVTVLKRMRQIYRPDPHPSVFFMENLINEILILSRDAMSKRSIETATDFQTSLPPVLTSYDLLLLAILSLVLNLCAGLDPGAAALLRLTLSREEEGLLLSLSMENILPLPENQLLRDRAESRKEPVALSPAREILASQGVRLEARLEEGTTRVKIHLSVLGEGKG